MSRYLFCLLILSVTSMATAQSPTPAPPACNAPEFRQFDFWLGKWNVRQPDGIIAGTSAISRVSEGCAVREDWTAAKGKRGMSINYYDSAAKLWHQDWVGGDGGILHLQGGIENGAMVLSDQTQANRITWTPLPEKKVKQEWSASGDGGKNWKTVFVGIYERRKEWP